MADKETKKRRPVSQGKGQPSGPRRWLSLLFYTIAFALMGWYFFGNKDGSGMSKELSYTKLTSYIEVGAIEKIEQVVPNAAKNGQVWLTERGSSFGYGRLVVDMTSLVEMRRFGCPVIFDATHSVQQPSSQAGVTGGNREMVPYLMRAALAVGIDGLFIETHPDPDKAISDAANQVRLSDMKNLLAQALEINQLVH